MTLIEPLTDREHEILVLISQGMSNQDIADLLYLSRGTVKAHNHNIYSKLGVTSRTQALLRAQELDLLNGSLPETPPALPPHHDEESSTLPVPLTPLIGRKAELDKLDALLSDPRVRLVTIFGAGGMGKTRISLETANRMRARFPDGVYFVSLARVSEPENVAMAIIEDMHLSFRGSNAEQQLFSDLQNKRLLLVLDNFEHLLDGAAFITGLLQAAPEIKLLITSRERLNLSAEVLFVLEGLNYHFSANADDLMAYDAIQLLVQRAQLVNPDFELTADNREAVMHVCRLTQGMPLAIVLACGWLEMLTLKEIAAEISENMDILETQLRDLPERQRSMRATIASSWRRLSKAEQEVFASLSVFRGGFTRDAARHIVGADLRILQKLINRAFITVHHKRYEIHELLRQFGAEELAKNPDAEHSVNTRHCEYFANFLFERLEHAEGSEKSESMMEVKTDLNNIRKAWRWAVDHGELELMYMSVQTLSSFFHMQGRYLEGIEMIGRAIKMLDRLPDNEQRELLVAIMYTELGWYNIRMGKMDESEQYLTKAHTIFDRLGYPFLLTTTDPLIGLALNASVRGNYAQAAEIGEKALRDNEARGHIPNQTYGLYILIGVKFAQGEYARAREYGQRAVNMAREHENIWLEAYCLIELGHVARAQGDYESARAHYQESYDIKAKFDDPEGMAVALNHLGELAVRRGDYAGAERLFQQSHRTYLEIHDQGGLATALHGLGQVALFHTDDAHIAYDYLQRSLELAHEIEYVPLIFMILLTVAELHLAAGHPQEAVALLEFVQAHPSANHETKAHAQHLLERAPQAQAKDERTMTPPDVLGQIVALVQSDLSRR